MAPSDDRDKDAKPSQSKPEPEPEPENPFIKFRQFADSQISSLLQGVLGLPSAFSKPTENPRWAVFDEDLRRRDELMAKQQALKDAEARRQNIPLQEEHSAEETVDIPVKTSPGWNKVAALRQPGPYQPLGYGAKDLPLYSPVTISLFHPEVGAADWGKPYWDNVPLGPAPYFLERGELSKDVMGMMRAFAENNLKVSSVLRSQHSLLPYLLYSPYSPMKLEADDWSNGRPRKFQRYNEAFVDLLATTSGHPGLTKFQPTIVPWELEHIHLAKASSNMQRIDWLLANGLLHGPESRQDISTKSADPNTEQEMYDTFLRLASLPAAATNTFESLFKEVETAVEKGLGTKEAASLRAQREAFEKEHVAGIKELEGILKSLGNPFREEKNRMKATETAAQGNPQDGSRVVSTRTTTEHSTHEDGTVETSVIVEKIFADGRVTTTHTSHVEDTSDIEDAFSARDASSSPDSRKETSGEDLGESKKPAKKGWFWN